MAIATLCILKLQVVVVYITICSKIDIYESFDVLVSCNV